MFHDALFLFKNIYILTIHVLLISSLSGLMGDAHFESLKSKYENEIKSERVWNNLHLVWMKC